MSAKIMPTPSQLECLTPVERLNFWVLDRINRTPALKRFANSIAATVGQFWVENSTSRIVADHGFEHFKELDPSRGVLLVANHRSFFDLYVVAARLFRLYGNHHNLYFPVRSNFFYSNPLGLAVNLPVGVGCMYPPIVRDRSRKEWNRFSTDVMVELLKDPSNMVGFHPEGTRNQGPDPYALLPGKQGCGELIHRARPNVVPVFLQGFPRYGWGLPLANNNPLTNREVIVHMVMGAPIDLRDELCQTGGPEVYQRIADRVMNRISHLAAEERRIRAGVRDTSGDRVAV